MRKVTQEVEFEPQTINLSPNYDIAFTKTQHSI